MAIALSYAVSTSPDCLPVNRRKPRNGAGVRALPVPFEMPVLEERLYWHRRNDADPGHRWMVQELEQVVKDSTI